MTKTECEQAISNICKMCFKKHELEYGQEPIDCAFKAFDNEDCPMITVLKNLIKEHFDEKTCTNESEYNLVDGFECSNCGIIIENYNEIEIDEDYPEDRCMKEYAPRYCPNCGRKIIDWKED